MSDLTHFICLFHDPKRARAAQRALQTTDLGGTSVQTLGDGEYGTGLHGSQSLTDLGVPERDLAHLQEGLRNGGVVVAVEAPEDRSDEIEKIFHRYTAEKIDEAELETEEPLAPAALAAAPLAANEPAEALTGSEAVIPVAEESLVVGKREVDRGGVRVFRRTVEEPVREDVELHGERVVLEYREVNRPATDADVRAGSQEIELIETAEVPVVQKVARVVEEVHVGRVESDRTETIQDTVRHTEVEVEPLDTRPGQVDTTRER